MKTFYLLNKVSGDKIYAAEEASAYPYTFVGNPDMPPGHLSCWDFIKDAPSVQDLMEAGKVEEAADTARRWGRWGEVCDNVEIVYFDAPKWDWVPEEVKAQYIVWGLG